MRKQLEGLARGTLSVLVLVSVLSLAPTAAAASQTWGFSSDSALTNGPQLNGCDGGDACLVMYKGGNTGGTGDVSLSGNTGGGETKIWAADEAAATDVTFDDQAWSMVLECTDNTALQDPQITVTLGSVDQNGVFTDEGVSASDTFVASDCGAGTVSLTLDPSSSWTVETGDVLAVRTEIDSSAGTDSIAISTAQGDTELTSPSSDPGYPIFELASLLLLAVGLIGVLGYRRSRR